MVTAETVQGAGEDRAASADPRDLASSLTGTFTAILRAGATP